MSVVRSACREMSGIMPFRERYVTAEDAEKIGKVRELLKAYKKISEATGNMA